MMPMREDVRRLVTQAKRDLANAAKNADLQAFEVAAFLCEQSVEKGLKALYAHKRRKRPPATHSLVELGADLAAPKALGRALGMLGMDYAATRYPDAANGIPGEIYTRDMARERIEAAREVWKWIDAQL